MRKMFPIEAKMDGRRCHFSQRKERLLKKQHRQAILLDSFLGADGLISGCSLRDRKSVTSTFDDYDRSINEVIKKTKQRQSSPEPIVRREVNVKTEVSQHFSYDVPSPKSTDNEETDEQHKPRPLDRRFVGCWLTFMVVLECAIEIMQIVTVIWKLLLIRLLLICNH